LKSYIENETETDQNLKKIMTPHWDQTMNLKRSRRELSHCASKQLGGSGLKCPAASYSIHAQCAAMIYYFRGHSCVLKMHDAKVAVFTVPTQFRLNNIHQRANTIPGKHIRKHPE